MFRELKFEMICRLHSDEMFRYARNLLGHAKDAEDIVQDGLLRLWNNLDKVGVKQSRSWLYRAIRNLCLDQLRRQSHHASPSYPGSTALNEMLDDTVGVEHDQLERADISNQIDEALLKLSEVQRSVFVLYEINGLRYREISEHLDIPLNSVKVHLLRARTKLQTLLKDKVSWINA